MVGMGGGRRMNIEKIIDRVCNAVIIFGVLYFGGHLVAYIIKNH